MHILTAIIALFWIAFWLYWIASASGAKRDTRPDFSRFLRIRIALFPLVVALILLFNHMPDSLKNYYQDINTNHIVLAVGLMLFLLGIFVAVWARVHLGKNWGVPMSQKQTSELVTSGPYRYIRHPIYTGILMMALGSFLDVNQYWLIVFIVGAIFFIYSAVVEEHFMMKQFPEAYPSYKSKTKMLIPFIF